MDQTTKTIETSSMSGLDFKIKEMAGRIRALREIEGLEPSQMAAKTGISTEEYLRCESGESDLNFAFIYRCALALNVNVTEIIEGYSPKLKSYTVTRAGAGQEIAKAHGMVYYNMAYAFQNRIAEPLFVRSAYSEEAQHKDIELTTHAGQELDIVIEGKLMVQVGEHTEVLSAGDTIYYDSDTPHGMIAVDGQRCVFLSMIMASDKRDTALKLESRSAVKDLTAEQRLLCNEFVWGAEDENGAMTGIQFANTDRYNFAFDTVDAIARREPDKLAMVHIANDMTERRFSLVLPLPQR